MSYRIEQLNSVLQKDIAKYAIKETISSEYIITITYVTINADLSYAKVGVRTFPDKKTFVAQTIRLLNKNRKTLQLMLARNHKLKNIPILEFVSDSTGDKVDRIEELLDKVDREKY